MGTWGTGNFDNDTAVDWTYTLEEDDSLDPVERALDKVIAVGDGYLEASDAEEALAAAEVVARLRGRWGVRNAYTETVDKWVARTKHAPTPELVRKSVAAIDRVLAESSELVELWEEDGASPDSQAWRTAVGDLRTRLLS